MQQTAGFSFGQSFGIKMRQHQDFAASGIAHYGWHQAVLIELNLIYKSHDSSPGRYKRAGTPRLSKYSLHSRMVYSRK